MKKFITLILIFATYNSFAIVHTKVTKTKGGLFGYKYIEETHHYLSNGDEQHILECSNPGMSGCKWGAASPTNNSEIQNKYLAYIELHLSNGRNKGRAILNDVLVESPNGPEPSVVVWNIEIQNEYTILSYDIYSLSEARSHGIVL